MVATNNSFRYLANRPSQQAFLRFSKFEERHRNVRRARAGFEKAIEVLLPLKLLDENFFIKFAEFEARHKEMQRSEMIYKEGLRRLAKGETDLLYTKFVAFQKQHAERDQIEDTVLNKRRFYYEDELKKQPLNYDIWFDYLRLEESVGDREKIRDLYERAVASVPPITKDKRYWRRYIFLWINYALFEELVADNPERCREVYLAALNIAPKKHFTFAKLYSLFAEFEVRQLQLDRARKIYGRAIAECGKHKIYSSYANLELRLGNIDRCRTIYAKQIETNPSKAKGWLALIDVELIAEETERASAMCELAIGLDDIDLPELIWKSYIDIETNYGTADRVRAIYERLLQKTQHYKVFKGYADFEYSNAGNIENARKVLERGLDICKQRQTDEERALLLEHWMTLERENGDSEKIGELYKRLPKKVKRRKKIIDEDGETQGFEEYLAYVFPDDGSSSANLKILEAAKAWKRKQAQQQQTEQIS